MPPPGPPPRSSSPAKNHASPTPTPSATLTVTPAISSQTPAPTEIPAESQLPPEITEKYLGQFDKWEKGTKEANGVETDVIYGFKGEIKKVIAMNIEIDGEMRMTRVGEYTDEAGFSYYTVMGKFGEIDGSMGGRFNVTDATTEKLFKIDPNKNIVNIWNSLASQWGLTPEQARDRVMIDNKGFAKFNVAVGIPESNGNFPSKSYGLPNEVDFNLPVEIITIATHEAFDALPNDLKKNLIYDHEIRRISQEGDGDPIIGGLVWVRPDGTLQIISVGTPVGHWGYLNPESLKEDVRTGTNKYLKEHIVPQLLLAVDLISNPSAPVPRNGVNAYFSQMNNIFEIDGFVNSSSQ